MFLIPILSTVLLDLSPQNKRIGTSLQVAYLDASHDQPDDAATTLQEVVDIQPWRTDVWQLIGSYYFNNQDWRQSIQAYQRAQELGLLSPEDTLRLGDAQLAIYDPQSALSTWMELNQHLGGSADCYSRIVVVLEKTGQYDEAIAHLTKWLALQPDDAALLYHLGLLLSLNNPADALGYLEKAAALDQSVAYQAGLLKSALNSALLSNDAAYQQVVIGRALAKLDRWDLAEQAFYKAVGLNPQYAEGWAFLGEARQQMGKDGINELLTAKSLNPDSVISWALLALYWRRQGRPELALADLERAAALEPKEPAWQQEIGGILAERGDFKAALDHYRKAVSLDPYDVDNQMKLAQFCAAYGYEIRTEGLPAARQALYQTPQDANALATMGWVMMALEDFVSAERFLLEAIQRDSQLASAHLHLAQVYLQEGNSEDAFLHLTLARTMTNQDPSSAEFARRLLEQYYGITNP
jgi:tetratricopeptide (TPR) repeat protein